MKLVNKGQRTYTIKDGQGTKSLGPSCQCEIEESYGLELVSASGGELVLLKEETEIKEDSKIEVAKKEIAVEQAANEEVAQIEETKTKKKGKK